MCSESLYRFGNRSSFSFSNNTQVYTGRLEVCLNGSYVPVCASALSYDELDDVCDSVVDSDGK